MTKKDPHLKKIRQNVKQMLRWINSAELHREHVKFNVHCYEYYEKLEGDHEKQLEKYFQLARFHTDVVKHYEELIKINEPFIDAINASFDSKNHEKPEENQKT